HYHPDDDNCENGYCYQLLLFHSNLLVILYVLEAADKSRCFYQMSNHQYDARHNSDARMY
ncbi:MAG: hypothetical protein ACI8V0_001863, partial [Pseudohongiellaceae bacterium]